jgi:3-oxoacyl-[acyl-carrier protein] reductase
VDLGIAGRRAIVCASSQGLGRACAEALAAEGVRVVLNGRDGDRLRLAAAEIAARHGVEVVPVAADLTTEDGRQRLLAHCPEPDILILNNAGPRPGTLDEITESDIQDALDRHFLAPLALLKAIVPGMRARGFGRVVAITSAMVATPRSMMLASAGARTGFTAVLKAIQQQSVADGVTVNALLPERIDSPRQLVMAHAEMQRYGISFDEARRRQAESIAAGHLGTPAQVGAACAFLCSVLAGYISGVNLRVDGGSFPGLL